MPTYAFVDAVSATPAVLFDLDNQSPFSVVVGTQTPPPTKRYSQTSSTSRDGDNIAQSSYNDRVLTIELRVELSATAEAQVEGIQKLGRLLDSEQWLMWQHDTMIEPVFFRTRRGDFNIDDSMMVDRPKRTVTLTIPAEPFAYGLPVTGTATIANDPTAANGMNYVFPDVQGDVASPLSFAATSTPSVGSGGIARCLLNLVSSSSARPILTFQSPSVLGSPTGWAATAGYADSAAFGGTTTRFVKTSGTQTFPVAFDAPAQAGDYRVLARIAVTSGASRLLYPSVPLSSGGAYHWYDLGVQAVEASTPTGAPSFTAPTGLTTASIGLTLSGDDPAAEIRVDAMALVPLSEEVGDVSTLLVGATGSGGMDGSTDYVDSIRQTFTSSAPTTPQPTNLPESVAGGFPSVCPGLTNTLNLIRDIANSGATLNKDAKTITTNLAYLYYPRYLYIRPATS